MVTLTINGKTVSVPQGTMLLRAVQKAGIDMPTLCDHEALAPYGACRLCMVAIKSPYHAVVASCAYPIEEGLVVETDAPEAVRSRRLTLEFLMSRCPQSDVIRKMAESEGLTSSRFGVYSPEQKDELCVLCGLCVRVCRDVIGAAAIDFIGRGKKRKVGTPFQLQSESCIGCGACAEICPTGAIKIEDMGNKRVLSTWNTVIELCACSECGRFFTPKPIALLKEIVPTSGDYWDLCPQCRHQVIGQKWLNAQNKGLRWTGRAIS